MLAGHSGRSVRSMLPVGPMQRRRAQPVFDWTAQRGAGDSGEVWQSGYGAYREMAASAARYARTGR